MVQFGPQSKRYTCGECWTEPPCQDRSQSGSLQPLAECAVALLNRSVVGGTTPAIVPVVVCRAALSNALCRLTTCGAGGLAIGPIALGALAVGPLGAAAAAEADDTSATAVTQAADNTRSFKIPPHSSRDARLTATKDAKQM